jgi:hypothetical protein
MTTSKYDMAYGRQGGRIVAFVPPSPPPVCDVCDLPVVSGLARHTACEPGDDQLDLFGATP